MLKLYNKSIIRVKIALTFNVYTIYLLKIKNYAIITDNKGIKTWKSLILKAY